MTDKDICLKVFEYLVKHKVSRPIDISNKIKVDRQLVDYHLKKLVGSGLVIKRKIEESVFYSPQPCFVDEDSIEDICAGIIPLINNLSNNIDLSESVNKKQCLKNVLINFIDMVLDE